MRRRDVLRGLVGAAAWLAFGDRAIAESQRSAEPMEEMQMPTFELFVKTNRNKGTYETNVLTWPPGVRSVEVRGLMDEADIIDPTLTLTWEIEATFDGVNWGLLVGGGWQGGLDDLGNPNGAPQQTWATSGPLPVQFRGKLVLSERVSLGLEIETF